MKVVPPSHILVNPPASAECLRLLEQAGRVCYKSEDHTKHDSAHVFLERLIKMGHLSVLEHISLTVRFICDRGVSHELVRHRLAAYSQESTRYANYSQEKFGGEITVIKPMFWQEDSPEYQAWLQAMQETEKAYLSLLRLGASPQQARSVLPNSLKTEVFMTANLREWRHIFSLRCAKTAHPQMQEIMLPCLADMHKLLPVIFMDLWQRFLAGRY